MTYPKKGKYRHFKGGEYELLYIARHSETDEPMVVYRALYEGGETPNGDGVWVRPLSMWTEMVTRDGKTFPRFSYVEVEEDFVPPPDDFDCPPVMDEFGFDAQAMEETPASQARDIHEVLKSVFGYSAFREGQEEVISKIIEGRDVLGVMPTGAGKSICYQVPALALNGCALVISPLISLMKDQVNALTQAGVAAAYLNSSLSEKQARMAYDNAFSGKYKIIYVAPERLLTERFLRLASTIKISLVAVDEAHCISQWGQDFRPNYLDIPKFIQKLPVRPRVCAFTATATDKVRSDIKKILKLQKPFERVTGFNRPNLYFRVLRPEDKFASLTDLMQKFSGMSGVIYCATRKTVEEVHDKLKKKGYPVTMYHAGLSDEERKANQEAFSMDETPIIVATNAFGMGIDKSDVRFVIHYNMPKDIESYYQEAGRAGRDGEDAVCCLLYHPSDVHLNTFLIEHSMDASPLDEDTQKIVIERAKERLRQMTYYATSSGCLRARILSYFGETLEGGRCGNCSACQMEMQERDVTREAGMIVAGVMALGGRYGKAAVAKVLAGSRDARIREKQLDKLSAFGSLRSEGEENIRAMIDELIIDEVLEITDGQYPLLRPGPRAREVLRGDEPVRMSLHVREPAQKRVKMKPVADKGLLSRLVALRRRIAEEQHVPPFIIFTNATLSDMAVKRPRTRAQMLHVAGVGENKMERYGDAFLRVVGEYLDEQA